MDTKEAIEIIRETVESVREDNLRYRRFVSKIVDGEYDVGSDIVEDAKRVLKGTCLVGED